MLFFYKVAKILLAVVGVALLFGIVNSFFSEVCEQQWKFSGYHSEYKLGVGCLVQIAEHTVVPEYNVKFTITQNAK